MSIESRPAGTDSHEGSAQRAPRTNLFLAATIEADTLNAPVRIRNLSEGGAMLEGPAFPRIGDGLTLRRLEMHIGGRVIWHSGSRCGVQFDGIASVPEWVSGKRSGDARHQGQTRVDSIQAAIRSNAPASPASEWQADGGSPELSRRIAEELAYVQRLLENMGDTLTDDPIIMQRHAGTVQGFDLASQILGHLANLLTARDQRAAVDAIGMEELRARLLRKAMFRP